LMSFPASRTGAFTTYGGHAFPGWHDSESRRMSPIRSSITSRERSLALPPSISAMIFWQSAKMRSKGGEITLRGLWMLERPACSPPFAGSHDVLLGFLGLSSPRGRQRDQWLSPSTASSVSGRSTQGGRKIAFCPFLAGFCDGSPSHGENRGSSPLGSANDINTLDIRPTTVSNRCPIYGCAPERTLLDISLARLHGD
jgi:hypothetical protein